ncbi:MAG TPA: heme-binding protein [Pseudomonas xinjiangensis]|uniref:Heme-binding protein n=2 Tax=root TaxID=1 RepID=A0A7V1BQR4_9GAMM|nr:heme-binding protein [Halopseudomonas xinjiangensis]HEC47202.1 heme-binding protein [Halopseudomonas xinjiangensis]
MSITVLAPGLRWEMALKAVETATTKALELDILINVAVVDQAGNPLAFARMNGSFLHSADIASDKAYTAASFGFPTSEWMEILEANPAMRLGFPQRPRLVVFGGGLPIKVDGQCIGGIGVSGGSEAQDELCARAGLEEILNQV